MLLTRLMSLVSFSFPENIRKLLVFKYFQVAWKETIGIKRVNIKQHQAKLRYGRSAGYNDHVCL